MILNVALFRFWEKLELVTTDWFSAKGGLKKRLLRFIVLLSKPEEALCFLDFYPNPKKKKGKLLEIFNNLIKNHIVKFRTP